MTNIRHFVKRIEDKTRSLILRGEALTPENAIQAKQDAFSTFLGLGERKLNVKALGGLAKEMSYAPRVADVEGGGQYVHIHKDIAIALPKKVGSEFSDASESIAILNRAGIHSPFHLVPAATLLASPSHLPVRLEQALQDVKHDVKRIERLPTTAIISGRKTNDLLTLPRLTIESAFSIIGQCILAVSALHEKKIAHRDIHPANFLYKEKRVRNPESKTETVEFQVYLCDMINIAEVNNEGRLLQEKAFIYHAEKNCAMPPEIKALLQEKNKEAKTAKPYTEVNVLACDIFSLVEVMRIVFNATEMPQAQRDALLVFCDEIQRADPRPTITELQHHRMFAVDPEGVFAKPHIPNINFKKILRQAKYELSPGGRHQLTLPPVSEVIDQVLPKELGQLYEDLRALSDKLDELGPTALELKEESLRVYITQQIWRVKSALNDALVAPSSALYIDDLQDLDKELDREMARYAAVSNGARAVREYSLEQECKHFYKRFLKASHESKQSETSKVKERDLNLKNIYAQFIYQIEHKELDSKARDYFFNNIYFNLSARERDDAARIFKSSSQKDEIENLILARLKTGKEFASGFSNYELELYIREENDHFFKYVYADLPVAERSKIFAAFVAAQDEEKTLAEVYREQIIMARLDSKLDDDSYLFSEDELKLCANKLLMEKVEKNGPALIADFMARWRKKVNGLQDDVAKNALLQIGKEIEKVIVVQAGRGEYKEYKEQMKDPRLNQLFDEFKNALISKAVDMQKVVAFFKGPYINLRPAYREEILNLFLNNKDFSSANKRVIEEIVAHRLRYVLDHSAQTNCILTEKEIRIYLSVVMKANYAIKPVTEKHAFHKRVLKMVQNKHISGERRQEDGLLMEEFQRLAEQAGKAVASKLDMPNEFLPAFYHPPKKAKILPLPDFANDQPLNNWNGDVIANIDHPLDRMQTHVSLEEVQAVKSNNVVDQLPQKPSESKSVTGLMAVGGVALVAAAGLALAGILSFGAIPVAVMIGAAAAGVTSLVGAGCRVAGFSSVNKVGVAIGALTAIAAAALLLTNPIGWAITAGAICAGVAAPSVLGLLTTGLSKLGRYLFCRSTPSSAAVAVQPAVSVSRQVSSSVPTRDAPSNDTHKQIGQRLSETPASISSPAPVVPSRTVPVEASSAVLVGQDSLAPVSNPHVAASVAPIVANDGGVGRSVSSPNPRLLPSVTASASPALPNNDGVGRSVSVPDPHALGSSRLRKGSR
jgi:hypothetical protein